MSGLKKLQQEAEDALKPTIAAIPLQVTNYYDNVEAFYESQPFFYDTNQIFWFWQPSESRWTMVDEIDLMNALETNLQMTGLTLHPQIKGCYLEMFKRLGRQRMPLTPPSTWLQFKNKIFDLKTGLIQEATPHYFIFNPIPWKLGESTDTPILDHLLTEWVGSDHVLTLKEILAYCCLPDYSFHTIFCFIGTGCNGKSQFLKILAKFLGIYNLASTELDVLITNRFESTKLYKKLACIMGETNFNQLKSTSLIKRLTGQDLIGFEYKHKKPFDAYNYAKIIIATNSLPSTEDTSEGFYRRWMILDFPQTFEERGVEVFERVPEEEYENLALAVTEILSHVFARGHFTHQGTIQERKDAFIMASNPLPHFFKEFCERHHEFWILYSEVYTAYCRFLTQNHRRVVSRKEFSQALLIEGLEVRKTEKEVFGGYRKNGWFVEGIRLKESNEVT